MKCSLAILLCLLGLVNATGQIDRVAQDTTILTYENYILQVLAHHPVAQQADLELQRAQAQQLAARGWLDPQLTANWEQKNFDDKLYYRYYSAELQVPTIGPVDIIAGYENTEGIFLNPESTLDEFGLWNVGIQANLLQGLLFNERQAAQRQAALFDDVSLSQQRLLLLDLLIEASMVYSYWQQYDAYATVLDSNLVLSATFRTNTNILYDNGEATALDTLEAFIMYRDALSMQLKNQSSLIKMRQMVENYLWFEGAPAFLQAQVRPEPYEDDVLNWGVEARSVDVSNHPALQLKRDQLSIYEIEGRWKRQKLLPKLKAKYHPLLSTDNDLVPRQNIANYKWGFDFALPLFRSAERGDLQLNQIKIQDTRLYIDNKANELQNKAEASLAQATILSEQIAVLERNIQDLRALLRGEQLKFDFGESSVFLLFKRQEKYIQNEMKFIESSILRQIYRLEYLYNTDQLIR